VDQGRKRTSLGNNGGSALGGTNIRRGNIVAIVFGEWQRERFLGSFVARVLLAGIVVIGSVITGHAHSSDSAAVTGNYSGTAAVAAAAARSFGTRTDQVSLAAGSSGNPRGGTIGIGLFVLDAAAASCWCTRRFRFDE